MHVYRICGEEGNPAELTVELLEFHIIDTRFKKGRVRYQSTAVI